MFNFSDDFDRVVSRVVTVPSLDVKGKGAVTVKTLVESDFDTVLKSSLGAPVTPASSPDLEPETVEEYRGGRHPGDPPSTAAPFRRGREITSIDDLRKGDLVVTYSKRFKAENLAKVLSVDTARGGSVTLSFVDPDDPSGPRLPGDKPFMLQSFQFGGDDEYYVAESVEYEPPRSEFESALELDPTDDSLAEKFRPGTASHFNALVVKWAKKVDATVEWDTSKSRGSNIISKFIIKFPYNPEQIDPDALSEFNELVKSFGVRYKYLSPSSNTWIVESDTLGEQVDKHGATELRLYIENDGDLYKQQLTPIIKNILRKIKSGKYDHKKASKIWMYLVDNGARKYVKEFGGAVKDIFPKKTREAVAKEMADDYKEMIDNGEFSSLESTESPELDQLVENIETTAPVRMEENKMEEDKSISEKLQDILEERNAPIQEVQEVLETDAPENSDEPIQEATDDEGPRVEAWEGDDTLSTLTALLEGPGASQDASQTLTEVRWDDDSVREEMARELDVDPDELGVDPDFGDFGVDAYEVNVGRNGPEYLVFEDDDDAEEYAEGRVKQDLETEPEIFNQSWLEDYITMGDTDRRLIAQDMADDYVDDLDWERVANEAGVADEYDEALLDGDDARAEEIVDEAREKLRDDMYTDHYERMKDPIRYFVNEEGLYSRDDLLQADFMTIDVDEAAQDAIREDGVAHFLAGYDGDENTTKKGLVYYRTN